VCVCACVCVCVCVCVRVCVCVCVRERECVHRVVVGVVVPSIVDANSLLYFLREIFFMYSYFLCEKSFWYVPRDCWGSSRR
jgi:hypothetical protein